MNENSQFVKKYLINQLSIIILFNTLNHIIMFIVLYYVFSFHFLILSLVFVSSAIINLFVWPQIFKNLDALNSEKVDTYLTLLLILNFPFMLFYLSTKHNGKLSLVNNCIDNYSEMICIEQEHQKLLGCFEYCIKYMKHPIVNNNIKNRGYIIDNSKIEISDLLKTFRNYFIIRNMLFFIIFVALSIIFHEFLVRNIEIVALFAAFFVNSFEIMIIRIMDYLKIKREFKRKNFVLFTVLLFSSIARYTNILFCEKLNAVYKKISDQKI